MTPSPETIPYGYCQCGCGKKTSLAPKKCTRLGWIKGEPQRYLPHHQGKPLKSVFAEKVKIVDGCWIWQGARDNEGYGRIGVPGDSAKRLAHRVAYKIYRGDLGDDLILHHKCKNKGCCNPNHLEPITISAHMKIHPPGRKQAAQTHCIRGHEFTEENTRKSFDGKISRRICRTCSQRSSRAWKERQRIA